MFSRKDGGGNRGRAHHGRQGPPGENTNRKTTVTNANEA